MSLTNPNLPVTEERLKDFYEAIKPYLGGGYSAGDGIEISNGEISTDNLQSGDMDDVVTPLPSIPTRYHKYSTQEQICGQWIDGSPIYEKTYYVASLTGGSDVQVAHGISNFGHIVNAFGYALRGANNIGVTIPHVARTSLNWTLSLSDIGSSYFYIEVGSDYTGQYVLHDCYITLQYTKTTT